MIIRDGVGQFAVKVEELDSSNQVVRVLSDYTIVYVPIWNGTRPGNINQIPSCVQTPVYLGSAIAGCSSPTYYPEQNPQRQFDMDKTLMPLTGTIYYPVNAIRVTDLTSEYYYISRNNGVTYYTKDGATLYSTDTDGVTGFGIVGSTNTYNHSFILGQYTIQAGKVEVSTIGSVGIRHVSNNDNRYLKYLAPTKNNGINQWFNATGGITEQVTPVIKHMTVKFGFPQSGYPFDLSIDNINVDIGNVTVSSIRWKSDGADVSGTVKMGERYTAQFTVTSSDAKFAQAIGDYVVAINTADTTEVYVKSIGAQFPDPTGNAVVIGVNFSAVGNTDPYYGDPDIESDPIEEPDLPTLSAVDTGFLTLYNPTLSEVQNLATYMWNADITTIEFWKKVVADPIDMILGFSLVPCAVPDGGSKSVVIGAVDTGVTMTKAASQFVRIDCGSVTINEEYGNYLDYEPYTKCELYLPYCGTHPISIDDIMGRTVHITYHVDILSGACVAYVMVNEVVYYIFAGNCAVSLPVTSQQFSDLIRSSISLVADVGALVATGGLSASLAGTGTQAAQIGRAIRGATMGIDTAAGAASTVMSMKPRMARSGNIGSMAGQLANQVPYFIFTRPRMSVANSQQTYQGYPTNQTYQLGSLSGFTQVQSIHLSGIPCTDDEMTEIYNLLSAGVII